MDKNGKDMFNRKLKRKNVLAFFANLPPCLVGLKPAVRRITGREKYPKWMWAIP